MIKFKYNTDFYFNKSLNYLKLSDYNTAIYYIDLAIDNSTNKSFYMYQKTKILFLASYFSECSAYIESNLDTFYNNSSIYIFSKLLLYYYKTSQSSISHTKQLLKLNNIPGILANDYSLILKNKDINYIKQAQVYIENQDFTNALDYSLLAIKSDPNNAYSYISLGKCYFYIKKYDLAIGNYNKAISLNSNITQFYLEIGNIFFKIKNYPRAIASYQKGLFLEPNNIDLLYNIGDSFYMWRKYDSALLTFKKITTLDKYCKDALLKIGDIYTHINHPKKAKRYYKKAIKLNLNRKCP